jgi:hypothetical protein
MSNKTISINPNLFSIGKTRKHKDKKNAPASLVKPLISPNVLKNKLLKRIKEHKHRETEIKPVINDNLNIDDISFTDDFHDSIHYLQTLAEHKKTKDRKTELERNTIKNHQSLHNNNSNQFVNLELPEELIMPTPIQYANPTKNTDSLPYGILKGGLKPTYRDWSKTQRHLIPQVSEINKIKSDRENRLAMLREKLRVKQQLNNPLPITSSITSINSTPLPIPSLNTNNPLPITSSITSPITLPIPSLNTNNPLLTSPITPSITSLTSQIPSLNPSSSNDLGTKQIITKTIKRKYTLGKSDIKKTVSVLVKNRETRKQIITAQKDLKRKPISDIKVYLRNHNLMKLGSTAPNDIIRKTFESAIMAGEITNSNSETLLHNFSKDEL